MTAPQRSVQSTALAAWEQLFYKGDRLRAEVSLFGGAFVGHIPTSELVLACAQIHRSYGVDTAQEPSSSLCCLSVSPIRTLNTC